MDQQDKVYERTPSNHERGVATRPGIAIFFGGPSPERDISLDSARTFYDCVRFILCPEDIQLVLIERDGTFTIVEDRWIYSNTLDDILLSRSSLEQRPKDARVSIDELVERIRRCFGFFSFVHGTFGEDGALEALLRSRGCSQPMLGSRPDVLEMLYDKVATYQALARAGYEVPEHLLITGFHGGRVSRDAQQFCERMARVVVKPRRGGSSDGVSLAGSESLATALAHASRFDHDILIEKFIDGREFSIIVFEDSDGTPLPLLPTEVRVADVDNPIYTRLKKYMPGSGASHVTPAAFGAEAIASIRQQAAAIFRALRASDWARFDGFLEPNGRIIWSDLNGVPGFGMDSLLFQQCALFGLDQPTVSYFLLSKVAARAGVDVGRVFGKAEHSKRVFVLGGGSTSERQVSRMSWLNVIQKLTYTRRYELQPVFVDKHDRLFEVSSFVTLQHTVEEIETLLEDGAAYVASSEDASAILDRSSGLLAQLSRRSSQFAARETSLQEIAKRSDFCFIALHGGSGEDGRLQAALDALDVAYNGSGPDVSALCMDKHATAVRLNEFSLQNFRGPRNAVVHLDGLVETERLERIADDISAGLPFDALVDKHALHDVMEQLRVLSNSWMEELESPSGLAFKPVADGCSTGVFLWRAGSDAGARYLICAIAGVRRVPWAYLGGNYANVASEVVLQLPFAETRDLLVEELHASAGGGRPIELTVAVFGKQHQMQALIPSETHKEFDVLTIEEKFCKGVGVNVTPPPELDPERLATIRHRVEAFANQLGLDGYARIDLMYYVEIDDLVLIEVNTLPGLSAATVTFTQALVTPGFAKPPSEFCEALMEVKLLRNERNAFCSTARPDRQH